MACLGTWRARKFAERRRTALQCCAENAGRAPPAGCGLAGAADLLASAQRALAAMISVLGPIVSKESLLLLLLDAGTKWSFCGVPK